MFVIVLMAILINTSPVQNWLVSAVTHRLSDDLKTKVSIRHVNFSLFNKMNLEGVYVEDRHKDTLLNAGRITVNITDWFFLKDRVELKNIELEDATVRLHRTDSVWNYTFIADYFSSPSTPDKEKKSIVLLLKQMKLANVHIKQLDEWRGQDQQIDLKSLSLEADKIDFSKKLLDIRSLVMDEPVFSIYDYPARRPKRLRPVRNAGTDSLATPFNEDGWLVSVKELTMNNGAFRSDRKIKRAPYSYFDDSHIHFFAVNAQIKDIRLVQDTLTANVKMSTRERSGFTVNSLVSEFRMEPGAMIFNKLDIKTPSSHLSDYYAMRYSDFDDDMQAFIRNVKLEGRFHNSTVHTKDIAYFAPALKSWNKLIRIDGDVKGTIDNLSAKNFVLESGKSTRLNGNIKMVGLPDIDSTYIDFRANDFQTTYNDVLSVAPALKDITEPRLSEIKYLGFKGTFTGFIRDFVTYGTLQTNLGILTTDVNMKFPKKGASIYSGKINTSNFDLGRLMDVPQLGNVSFNGTITGKGFTAQTMDAELDGKFARLQFKNYDYTNIAVKGRMNRKLFKGNIHIDDPNVIAILDGDIDFNAERPEFNFFADIQRSNLKTLGFARQDMNVIGKFDMNFNGDNIDNFLGTVSLYDVAVTRDNETYVFDTLTLSSQTIDQQKILQLRNTEASAFLIGNFTIRELPDAVKQFLNKYYPAYIPPPDKSIKNQNFLFQLDVKNIDQYLALIHPSIRGFNNSTIVGSLNSETNLMAISAMIPYASYKNIGVHDFRLTGVGNMDSLKLTGIIGNTVINDSLQFPGSKISIASSNNQSQLSISTSATQTINDAKLSAQITNLEDGVEIHLDPGSIVLNEKTWRINDGGEMTISKAYMDARNIKFTNGEQEISIVSKHSDVGTWDDIIVDMKKVNIGDFMPFIVKEPRMEGIVTGTVTIEDAFRSMYVSANLKTEQFRLANDSVGTVNITGAWDDRNKKAIYEAISDNKNYKFSIAGSYDVVDSLNQEINANANFDYTNIHFLEQYLGSVFGNIKGFATGNLRMKGNIKAPEYTGEIMVRNAGLKVLYTQCFYEFDSAKIVFAPGSIHFGTVILKDTLYKHNREPVNTATLTGDLQHNNFRDFVYNISINTNRLLMLNTTRSDNGTFYGKAIGKGTFRLRGPEDEMRMSITGETVDSSSIYITSASSKESSNADYIIWKQYGKEMNYDSIGKAASELNVDLNLTANNYTRMYMVLDEITGDIIEATGSGTLKMHTGTNAPFTINGKYTIDQGYYRFSFQEIFKKPFILLPNEGSYIRWDGDPYKAEINLRAKYIANDVKLSSLYSAQGQTTDPEVSRLKGERTDVDVLCTLTGSLGKPDIVFDISLAANSDVKNSQRLLGDLQRINSDDNEKNKQVAYLIVFRSFAPIGQYNVQQTDAATFAFNTISEYISGYLSSSLKTLLYGIFKDPSLSVNFNYTRASIDPTGTGAGIGNTVNLTRDNISLQFIKSLLNDKLVITFGSDFNFVSSGSQAALNAQSTSFLFLPDITAEYKITPDGKFRISCFYRSNFDALSTTGKRNRAGGSISFRTEFDPESLRRKKEQIRRKDEKEQKNDSTSVGSLFNNARDRQ
ncbi:MAG: translocation/assembly module TamB domain-containing protein [Chitinophagaceae bacterium]|nr:translocation/assembly module TamB domain-containing protein [Chitinophagaceae bacterium]